MSREGPDLDARNPEMKEASVGESKGYWRGVWKRYRRRPAGMIGLVSLGALLTVAFFTPLFAGGLPIACRYKGEVAFPALVATFHKLPYGSAIWPMPKPYRFPQFDARIEVPRDPEGWAVWPLVPWDPNQNEPLAKLQGPSSLHRLGTDELGRDVLARMIHATPVAMLIGFVSMGIATLIGVTLGSLAGYLGRKTDIAISRVVELFICVPAFYVILAVLTLLKPSIWNVMVVLGFFMWTSIARYTRGEFLKLKGLDYAVAARALGAGTGRIVFRHLLPNSLAPVLVVVAFGVASSIFVESGLSWLGFGVMPPTPTWGNILRSGWDNLRVAPHIIFPPSVAIFVAVLTMNLIGDALRDVTDPRLTGSA
jgi:peptide/nickel transport system permease protein